MTRRSPDEHLEQLLKHSLANPAASAGVCPDGGVVAAFIDGGLDPAERLRMTQHASSCVRCAQILALAVEPPASSADVPSSARPWRVGWRWMVPFATAATVAGIWVFTRDAVPPVVPARPAAVNESASVNAPAAPSQSSTPSAIPSESPAARDRAVSAAPSVPPAPLASAQPSVPPASPPAPAVELAPAPVRPQAFNRGGGGDAAGGVAGALSEPIAIGPEQPVADVQSTSRQVNVATSLWRAAGTVIQRSLDGGRTWTSEFEAPRAVLGVSTGPADVGWFVGVRGLVVRRIGSAWSIVNAPDTIDITGVEATSERSATVTLADGRRFTTTDGGQSWTTP